MCAQAESADNDSDTAPSRSTDQGLQQSPSTKQESAEALKQQLKLLMQMQEENKKCVPPEGAAHLSRQVLALAPVGKSLHCGTHGHPYAAARGTHPRAAAGSRICTRPGPVRRTLLLVSLPSLLVVMAGPRLALTLLKPKCWCADSGPSWSST